MDYKARNAYKDSIIVDNYERERFYSFRGRVIDMLEKSAIEKAIKYVSLPENSKILDLPCGTGRVSIFLAKKGYLITGGDVSLSMVNKSIENAKKINVLDKTNFLGLDAVSIDYPGNYFDAVVSLRLFGHTPPEVRMNILREFKRVGRKYFILAYYIKNSFQEILRRKKRLKMGTPWYPVSFKDINLEIEQAGMKKLKVFPVLKGFSETAIILCEAFPKI